MAESEVIRSLFVTLRRGLAGKPRLHRRIVEALGLGLPHECVEKPNNASIRGMLMKVRRSSA
jgi:large subunit ribosomal protein L30